MATNDKEATKPTDRTDEKSTKTPVESETKSLRLGGATVGIAVAVGVLLLLGGTAVGFMTGHSFDRDDRGGRFGFMQSVPRNNEGFAVGERYGSMRGHMFGGTYGEVTNVSDSSITLTDERLGGSVTFKIDSNTDVNDENGDNAKVSDIKVGDNVLVRGTSATDDTAADTIVINPNR